MKRTFIYSMTIATLFSTVAPVAIAADRDRDQDRPQKQGRIYASPIMTQKERNDYRALMNAARTGQERDQIRQAHQEQMQERARQRGVTLPNEPPAYGKTPVMGSGSGMGGTGGGVGPGSRRLK